MLWGLFFCSRQFQLLQWEKRVNNNIYNECLNHVCGRMHYTTRLQLKQFCRIQPSLILLFAPVFLFVLTVTCWNFFNEKAYCINWAGCWAKSNLKKRLYPGKIKIKNVYSCVCVSFFQMGCLVSVAPPSRTRSSTRCQFLFWRGCRRSSNSLCCKVEHENHQ